MSEESSTKQISDSMKEDTLIQLYWAIYETWSAQVDSYWTRTNYFAAFEVAAIAGTWALLNARDFRVGHWCAVLAPLLTLGWIFSNVRSHDYHTYWWAALKDIEAYDGWTTTKPEYASKYEDRRDKIPLFGKLPYSIFTDWVVPIFFFIVWVFILQIDWHGTTHNEPVLARQAGINDNPTDWWLVAFTGALAVVAALQFGALMWQIVTTRKTAEKELRAYIFPSSVSRVEDNGVLKLKVVLTNSGKTPARQCVSWVGEGVATTPRPIFPKVPPKGTHSHYFLAAGSDMWIFEDAVQVSAAESQMIANGSRFYFVHGKISYRDAFNKIQTTQFRFASNGDNFAAGRFVFCDDGNDAT